MPELRQRRSLRSVRIASAVALTAATTGYGAFAADGASVAHAAGAVSVSVASSPGAVSTSHAMAYTITVANTGGADASGLTITDTFPTLSAGNGETTPATTTSTGSCGWDSTATILTCTAAALPAGAAWTVTATGLQTAAVGTTLADTATVAGTESGATFSAAGDSSTVVTGGLPAGFTQTTLAKGLSKPTVLAFPPGGDIWIGEQGGTILDYRTGATVLTLPNVYSTGETGLLGMALDPNFATNGYVYLSYTANVTNASGVTQPLARLSRFTYSNGTIDPATEKVYVQGNQVQNTHHAANTVKIGPDGKLWWSVGDNVPSISNAQALSNIYGKILRYNLDATVPADNPYVNVAGAVPAIYADGVRNPFRFTFLPGGQPFMENTGSPGVADAWEDLYLIHPGDNYGWPYFSGYCGSCGYINPTYEYGHIPNDGAASAVAAYSGTAFPAAYQHTVFVGDYNRRDIQAVGFDPTYQTPTFDTVFDTNAGTISDLEEGPDGNLYFTSIFEGTISEISAPGPFPPASLPAGQPLPAASAAAGGPAATITAPSTYNAGDTVSFSGTATDPADGTLPGYDYTWQVDFVSNGVVEPSYYAEIPSPFFGPSTGATSGTFTIPTDPYQVPGSYYQVTLTVTDSKGLQTVVTKTLQPNLTSFTVNANVAGAGFYVDGTWHTGPYTTQDVVGVHHELIGMALPQVVGGTRYRLSGWADGSALTDSFTSGTAAATYTASYEPVTATMPSGWTSTDIGAPITAGTADYATGSQSFYLDGAGADEYGANDQSHFVYQTLSGDGSIIARVRYQTNSDPWAKAGLMIRQSTATGAPFVDALVTPDVSPNTPEIDGPGCNASGCLAAGPAIIPAVGYGVREQASGSHSATGPALTGFTDPNKWLKLVRAGSTFTSYESTDGSTWTQIGVQTVAMTGPVDIGLFDTGHDIGQVSTAAFDNVSVSGSIAPPPPGPLPSPWADGDVGSPALAGSAGYTNGVFSVTGAGTDIWGASDQFNYVSQPLAGDGNATIIARVTAQSNTSSNAKAGVIIKQSTAAGSDYMLIAVAPNGTVKVQYDFNGSVTASASYPFPNVWMKLVSLNGKITAYLSPDGVTWTSVASKTLPITFPATIGLFECSHNASALGTATFDNVSVTPGP
jgi:glucose/arabinose dehydrogenase